MRRPCPAALTVAAAVVGVGAANIRFHRRGERMVTDVLRNPFVLGFLTLLPLHAWKLLGRWDPFSFAARHIPPSPRKKAAV